MSDTKEKLEVVSELVKLDLVGLDGNAFSILGAFRRAARKQGCPQKEIDAVVELAMSGDYDHLLRVMIANTTTTQDEE